VDLEPGAFFDKLISHSKVEETALVWAISIHSIT